MRSGLLSRGRMEPNRARPPLGGVPYMEPGVVSPTQPTSMTAGAVDGDGEGVAEPDGPAAPDTPPRLELGHVHVQRRVMGCRGRHQPPVYATTTSAPSPTPAANGCGTPSGLVRWRRGLYGYGQQRGLALRQVRQSTG